MQIGDESDEDTPALGKIQLSILDRIAPAPSTME